MRLRIKILKLGEVRHDHSQILAGRLALDCHYVRVRGGLRIVSGDRTVVEPGSTRARDLRRHVCRERRSFEYSINHRGGCLRDRLRALVSQESWLRRHLKCAVIN